MTQSYKTSFKKTAYDLILAVIGTAALINSTTASAKPSPSIIYENNLAIKNQAPGYFRFNLGNMQITALYDGVATLPAAFFKGISPAEVENHWKNTHDHTPRGIEDSVNAYLINTGSQLIMVDAGGAQCFPAMGQLIENLRQSGYQPSDIDAILISHFHPDHSCGISDEQGNGLFSKAVIYVEEKEAAYWLSNEQMNNAPKEVHGLFLSIQKAIKPYQNSHRMKTFQAGSVLLNGVETIAAYGHTPGHTVYQFNSDGKTAVFWGDLVHSTAMQLENPNISFEYDYNQAQAIQTRKSILMQASRNRWLIGGAHVQFPGLGYVRQRNTGYEWTAVKYQSIQP